MSASVWKHKTLLWNLKRVGLTRCKHAVGLGQGRAGRAGRAGLDLSPIEPIRALGGRSAPGIRALAQEASYKFQEGP
jgi:hypothetical protein